MAANTPHENIVVFDTHPSLIYIPILNVTLKINWIIYIMIDYNATFQDNIFKRWYELNKCLPFFLISSKLDRSLKLCKPHFPSLIKFKFFKVIFAFFMQLLSHRGKFAELFFCSIANSVANDHSSVTSVLTFPARTRHATSL